MMNKTFPTMILACAAAVALCSCDALKSLGSSSDKTGTTATKTTTAKTEKKKKPALAVTDRVNVAPSRKTTSYTPEELAKGAVKGDWAILTVFGKDAVGDRYAPFLKFEPTQGRVYGNNGCNTYNADYTYNATDSTLSFQNALTTMMACPSTVTDVEVNNALNQTRYYSWKRDDSRFYLTFYDARHQPVMTLMHQNFQFLNGTWRVTAIKNIEIDESALDEPMRLVIDIDEGKVHGNTGCNVLNGRLEVNMEAPNSISFQDMATTRRACPPGTNYENELLVALEEVTTAHPVNKERVDLLNGSGEIIITLLRTSEK